MARPKGSKNKVSDVERAFQLALRGRVDPALKVIDNALASEDQKIALQAAQDVLDRAYGKAKPKPDEQDQTDKAIAVYIHSVRPTHAAD